MRILAFDSAASHCSAAVVTPETVLGEISSADTETHSRHLMERIHQVLSDCRLCLSEIDGFAVTHGPGSFTGLRIGLSTAKGLAVAAGKPVVTISTLDVLAFQLQETGILISPMLDARKGEVYFSRCRFATGSLIREMKESVGEPETAVAGIQEPCIFIGEGASRYRKKILELKGDIAHFPKSEDHAIRASALGRLGLAALRQNQTADPSLIIPLYIRGAEVRKVPGNLGIPKMNVRSKKGLNL